jgi:DNA-binding cell septation regulator SpoVG
MLRTGFEIKVTILNTDNTKRPLAEAELVFKDGPLDGINLEGFAIWANKEEDGFNVTFPSKPTNGGKRKYYDLFRPTTKHARTTITEFILAEFRREVAKAQAREAEAATA